MHPVIVEDTLALSLSLTDAPWALGRFSFRWHGPSCPAWVAHPWHGCARRPRSPSSSLAARPVSARWPRTAARLSEPSAQPSDRASPCSARLHAAWSPGCPLRQPDSRIQCERAGRRITVRKEISDLGHRSASVPESVLPRGKHS